MTEVQLTKIPPSKPIMTLVEGDAGAVAIKMTVGVEQDGVDLTGMTWTVTFSDAGKTKETVTLTDVQEEEDQIVMTWPIPDGMTDTVGMAMFQVTGAATDLQWSSAIYWCNVTAAL